MIKNQENFLNAIYQNAKTGMQSIKDILDSIKNENLKSELQSEYNEYEKIATECENYASNNSIKIKDNSMMEKVRLYGSIKISTMMDNSTRHIAEMLLLGTIMGLNTCYKDRWDYKNQDKNLMEILKDLEKLEENNYENLKKFLKTEI